LHHAGFFFSEQPPFCSASVFKDIQSLNNAGGGKRGSQVHLLKHRLPTSYYSSTILNKLFRVVVAFLKETFPDAALKINTLGRQQYTKLTWLG
jgi:hypothetical protein